MFELFTDEAKDLMVLSREEAWSLRHKKIGTEHMLLGLLRQDSGATAGVLKTAGIDYSKVLEQVIASFGRRRWRFRNYLPFAPDTKQALEKAYRSTHGNGHQFLGTEHVLVGLVSVEGSGAVSVLSALGVSPDHLVSQIEQSLSGSGNGPLTQDGCPSHG
ncbi:Clp protease N-terminal domain-containing protein [Nocardiopsis valliformis]|uniref:Clp protease N-terminal domain-containing protein n=1 Tax=Nocardiopsis valliformis TaxID=239974 RepID=UPI000346E4C6|nr:Clp protease N-terminal domain-containing protein [Nocardiopsis valliformis]